MNKFKLFLIFLIIPLSVSAECSSSQRARYRNMASNINSYSYFNGTSFDVVFYNISNEFNIVSKDNGSSFRVSDKFGEYKISGVQPGKTYTYYVYPINNECSSIRSRTFYLDLPYYNKYYSDPVCVGSTSSLCNKWLNTANISHEEFIKRVTDENKETEIQEIEPEKVKDKKSFFEFLSKYYMLILILIIIFGSYGIYFLNKKDSFNFKT